MMKRIAWCKENLFLILSFFLVAFIPLYPKIPLIDVTQTWVYVRLEDVLVFFSFIALAVHYIRKRNLFADTPLTIPIVWYLGIGLLSLVNAIIFIFPYSNGQYFTHLGVLHYLRRIEYISLFFLGFEAFRRTVRLPALATVIACTFAGIVLYGFGQKFWGWPAFLTMNEEFAKGIPLQLPSTARIPSLFGGHYDLAAYLVFMIPIIGSFVIGTKTWWQKVIFLLLSVGGLVLLLFTASRISFGVYLVAISTMLFWHKKYWLIPIVIVASIFILNITSGASERFYKTFRVSNVIVDLSTGKPIGTLEKLEGTEAVLQEIESPAEETLPKGSGFISIPKSGEPIGETVEEGTEGQIKKVTMYTTADITTGSGDVATLSGSFLIQKALVYDISITTRFQGQWPRAMAAFQRNIFLGSGFSTLSVAADGDYHRMLGETGLLGTVAFLGIFAYSFLYFWKVKESLSPLTRSFTIGVFSGLVGLLANAVLIDVFEASKVALTMWLMLGFAFAAMVKEKALTIDYLGFLKRIFTHKIAYPLYMIIILFLIWGKATSLYFMGDDFTWLRWATESKLSDILEYFTVSNGFFYRPIPKLVYFMQFSVIWLKPFSYHLTPLLLLSGTMLCLYRFLRNVKTPWIIAWIGALLFMMLSIHHENIFWVSGQSSVLAGFFFMAALALVSERIFTHKIMKWVQSFGIILCTALSMLSYDGMVVAPLILSIVGYGIFKRGKKVFWILALIPLYILLRNYAGSVPPSGDYGYKWSTFIVNSCANSVTYFVSVFTGPIAIEWAEKMRVSLKTFLLPITIGIGILIGVFTGVALKNKRIINSYKQYFIWALCFILSLAAYLGLGGTSERYVYIASLFVVIAITRMMSDLFEKKLYIWFAVVLLGVVNMGIWNVREIERLYNDWKMAGTIVEQSLLKIKKETFPPKDRKTFFILNTPIRYGRAWIYPTGMTDAIWHMYRQSPFRVIPVSSLADAFSFELTTGDREVFVFDGYELKRGIREETVVEPTHEGNK